MNNKLTMLLAAGALVVGAQQAKALSFSDADDFTDGNAHQGITIAGGGGSYSDTFNIIAPDGTSTFKVANAYGVPTAGAIFNSDPTFNMSTDTIITDTGSMGFWFRVGADAVYDVQIEDINLSGNGNGVSITRNVLLQTGLSVTIEAALQSDGFVTYEITNGGTGFSPNVQLDYAYLTIDANRRPPVTTPDGGATAMLVGLGCLGLAGVRRKLS